MNEVAVLIERLAELEQRVAALESFPQILISAFERADSIGSAVEPRAPEAPDGARAGGTADASIARPAPRTQEIAD